MTHVWAEKGTRPTAVQQTEYECCYLFGAVNPLTDRSSAMLAPTVNTDYMNAHLRFISAQLQPGRHAVLVLDRAGWHVAKALQLPKNVTLLHLPPYSPQLNPIERLWAYLKSHYLSNRLFKDYDDLFEASKQAWNALTESDLQSICHTEWVERCV